MYLLIIITLEATKLENCLVYQLTHQLINCFKRFENRRFGHYKVALISMNTGSTTITRL